jgi:hypothetical protein
MKAKYTPRTNFAICTRGISALRTYTVRKRCCMKTKYRGAEYEKDVLFKNKGNTQRAC